jgi:hypothetical protein
MVEKYKLYLLISLRSLALMLEVCTIVVKKERRYQEKEGGTNAEKYQLQSHGNYYDNIKKPLSI